MCYHAVGYNQKSSRFVGELPPLEGYICYLNKIYVYATLDA